MIKISNYNFLKIEDAGYHRLLIGKSGENEYRSFCFDISKWLEKYPEGIVTAIFKRPDGVTYPVAVSVDGEVVTWTVTATELAASGKGELELSIHFGEVIGKSASIITVSEISLEPTVTPTDPDRNWFEDIVNRTYQAAAIANEAAENANKAAEEAKEVSNVTHEWNGTTLTVTSASGTSSADLKGEDGAPGKDGAQGPQGEKGETGAQGVKGADGEKGEKGDAGADGLSATHFWDGTTLTITSASGTSSADLKGEKGDTGAQGPKGETGEQGPRGENGKDGKSAYEYAKESGYGGTETDFSQNLSKEVPTRVGQLENDKKYLQESQVIDSLDEWTINRPLSAAAGARLQSEITEITDSLDKVEWQAYKIKEGIDAPIMETKTISFSDKSTFLSGYSLVNGVSYVIVWNGLKYECIANEVDGEIYVGDYDLMTSETLNKYPFLILYYGGEGGMVFKVNSLPESVNLSISAGTIAVYNKMPEEYLPDSAVTEDEIPTKLPNPNALKFTGAVNATYDGTSAVTVNIPFGSENGGASVQADIAENDTTSAAYIKHSEGYGYIKSIKNESIEIYSNDAVLIDAEGNCAILLETDLPLVIGEKYTVVFNGSEYECVATDTTEVSGGTPSCILGNLAVIGLEDTGEPFVIMLVEGTQMAIISMAPEYFNTTITLSITSHTVVKEVERFDSDLIGDWVATKSTDENGETVYNTIPTDFLPSCYVAADNFLDSHRERKRVFEYLKKGITVFLRLEEDYAEQLIALTISNDTTFDFTKIINGNNLRLFSYYNDKLRYGLSFDSSGIGMSTIDPSTQQEKTVYLHIDHNGIPYVRNHWTGFNNLGTETKLLLKSSTEGSNKKFKITVDDSGNISAVEA